MPDPDKHTNTLLFTERISTMVRVPAVQFIVWATLSVATAGTLFVDICINVYVNAESRLCYSGRLDRESALHVYYVWWVGLQNSFELYLGDVMVDCLQNIWFEIRSRWTEKYENI